MLGSLEALRRYPVKSLRGEPLERAEIGPTGIPGDRAAAFFARDGAREGKTYRGKENDRLHLLEDAETAKELARERGVGVEIRRDEHFFDDAPISLIVDAWLADVSAEVGYPVRGSASDRTSSFAASGARCRSNASSSSASCCSARCACEFALRSGAASR